MDKSFRLRRFYRNLGITGLVFFGGVLLLIANSLLWGPARAGNDVFAIIFIACFFLANAAMFGWLLLAYARGSLTITDRHVIKKGIIGATEISLAELLELQWKLPTLAGSVVLRSKSARIEVNLCNLEPEARGKVTRLLRWWAPDSFQRGWEAFCYMVALPQRELDEGRSLRDDETLLTRWRLYWTYSSAFLFLGVAFLVRDLWLGVAPDYAKGAVLLVLSIGATSLFTQFLIPKTGKRIKQLKPRSRIARTCLFIWDILAYVGVIFFIVVEKQLAHSMLVLLIGAAVLLCLALALLLSGMRQRRRDYQRNADLAAEEWERLEREAGEKPEQGASGCQTSEDL
jgi:hypothetical protein